MMRAYVRRFVRSFGLMLDLEGPMILRELQCPRCLLLVERFVRSNDVPALCPHCAVLNQASIMQRVVSVPAIRGATVSRS